MVEESSIETNVSTVLTVSTKTNREAGGNESHWTIVKNKQKRRQSKEVLRGKNTSITEIQAIERMKHLHVWRLHPETTVENLSTYVEAVCDSEVKVKIEKVNLKMEYQKRFTTNYRS